MNSYVGDIEIVSGPGIEIEDLGDGVIRVSGTGEGTDPGNGLWIHGSSSGQLATSRDGITWTVVDSGLTAGSFKGIAYGDGKIVAITGTNPAQLSISTDGITWTTSTITGLIGGTNGARIIYAAGLWVAAGASPGTVATSPDGITWTLVSTGLSAFGIIGGLAYGNGTWVIVGSSGAVATSPDAETWTVRSTTFGSTALADVHFADGFFVAVGASGTLGTSSDGITWVQRTTSITYALRSVTYSNELWVVVGGNSALLTSPNGVTWTYLGARSNFAVFSSGINGVAWGNGLYVAVGEAGSGDYGQLITSTDAKAWTLRPSGIPRHLECVAFVPIG